MSIPAILWAIERARELKLPSSKRMLYIAIADRSNGDGYCYAGQEGLGADSGLTSRQVRKLAPELEKLGLIQPERRGRTIGYYVPHPKVARKPEHSSGVTPEHSSGNAKPTPEHSSAKHRKRVPVNGAGDSGDTGTFGQRHRNFSSEIPEQSSAEPFLEPVLNHSVPNGTDEPAVAASSPSSRELLFSEGVRTLQRMLGVMDTTARNFLGKLLSAVKDDADLVLAKLREAEEKRVIDPAGWLIKACVPFRSAGIAMLAEEGSSVQAAEMEAAWNRLNGGVIGHA